MRVDFVNEVARILDIKRKNLIEKDLILHQMLSDLSKDDFFSPNFLFKGGTCLSATSVIFDSRRTSISLGKTNACSTGCRKRKSDHTYPK